MACDIGHPSWITFLTSAPTIQEEKYLSGHGANSRNEPMLTTAPDVEKYCIWPALPQFEDTWICRHPSDLEPREPEPTNARIRINLNAKHDVTVRGGPIQTATYLVGILLNFDNMLL